MMLDQVKRRLSNAVVSKGLSVFGVRIFGTAIALLTHIYISNTIGDGEYGTYTFVLSWIAILTLTSVVGMDVAVLRYFSAYFGNEDREHQRGLVFFARKYVLACSLVTFSCVVAIYGVTSNFFEFNTAFSIVLLTGTASVVFTSQNMITNALFRAIRRPVTAVALPAVGRPAILGVLVAGSTFLFSDQLNAVNVIGCYCLASILVGVTGLFMFHHVWNDPSGVRRDAKYEKRQWAGSASTMAFASGFRVVMQQCNVLMVGMLVDMTSAGYYSAVVRIVSLTVFGLSATNFVVAPLISDAYSRNNQDELRKTLRTTAKLILVLTLPILLVVLGLGYWLLGRWGDNFTSAYPCLVILCVAQFANACCGCVGFLLTMTGRERNASVIWGVAAVVNIVLNLILIPLFGIYGAAISSAIATLIWNFWMLSVVIRTMKLNPTIFRI